MPTELTDCIGEVIGESIQTRTGPDSDLAAPQPSVSVPPRAVVGGPVSPAMAGVVFVENNPL